MSDVEKRDPSLKETSSSHDEATTGVLSEDTKSAGVIRIEAMYAQSKLSTTMRVLIVISFLIVSYPTGLDIQTRYVYNAAATASYDRHALIATIGVATSIMGTALQPPLAKFADLYGRTELLYLATIFYTLGGIIQATSQNVETWAGGTIIYQVGYSGFALFCNLFTADMSSMRERLFWNSITGWPYWINSWIGGYVTDGIMNRSTYRWGFGMWALMYPICALPLLFIMYYLENRARQAELLKPEFKRYPTAGLKVLFWESDIIGMFLLIVWLSCLLIPFTLSAGTNAKFHEPWIIALLVIGCISLIGFFVWEIKFAQFPAFPGHLFRNRTVVGALMSCMFWNLSMYLAADFFYTQLYVFGESVLSATRISSLLFFVSTVLVPVLGWGVHYFRLKHIRWIMTAAVPVTIAGFAIMIAQQNTKGFIAGQVVLGLSGGFATASGTILQTAVTHQHLALVTSVWAALIQLAAAFGYLISGAIWTNKLPGLLAENMGSELAASVYGDPFTAAYTYPIGTPERDGMITAYHGITRSIFIAAISFTVLQALGCLISGDPELSDEQSDPQAEKKMLAERGWFGFERGHAR